LENTVASSPGKYLSLCWCAPVNSCFPGVSPVTQLQQLLLKPITVHVFSRNPLFWKNFCKFQKYLWLTGDYYVRPVFRRNAEFLFEMYTSRRCSRSEVQGQTSRGFSAIADLKNSASRRILEQLDVGRIEMSSC